MNYTRGVKYKMNSNIKMLSTKFPPNKMELPSKILQQIALNTRPKAEEHMLIVMDKSTQEGHFYQPLQTNKKQLRAE